MPRPDATESAAAGVTVVIPTFNRRMDVERALQGLASQTVQQFDVVVVDNSSTDGTLDAIARLAPAWQGRLHYVCREPNGPASARNTGLALAKTPYVLFHDSDIELPADWIERALEHMAAAPRMAAVGGFIIYAFDRTRVNAYGGDIGRMGLAWDVDEGSAYRPREAPAARIWINCSAMLARADAVRSCGAFDEAFFYGYEDSDLGWRLNLTGHEVAVYPDLAAVHYVSPDPGFAHPEIVFHYCKNRLRSMLKNASGGRAAVMLGAYAIYWMADFVARAPRRAKWRAVTWNLRNLSETLAMRRALQRQRRTPDAQVFRLGEQRWLPPTPLWGRRRRTFAGDGSNGRDNAHASDDRV